ncbi:hypothetical protein ACFWFQ_20430 [Nocardia salmonicida]|uniref:hypothetical protein n=1 Tax=Nocardia salmonicida TaxID=53431 RepID=UPI00364716A2
MTPNPNPTASGDSGERTEFAIQVRLADTLAGVIDDALTERVGNHIAADRRPDHPPLGTDEFESFLPQSIAATTEFDTAIDTDSSTAGQDQRAHIYPEHELVLGGSEVEP